MTRFFYVVHISTGASYGRVTISTSISPHLLDKLDEFNRPDLKKAAIDFLEFWEFDRKGNVQTLAITFFIQMNVLAVFAEIHVTSLLIWHLVIQIYLLLNSPNSCRKQVYCASFSIDNLLVWSCAQDLYFDKMLIKTVAIAAVLIFTVFADEQPKWGGNFEPSNTDYLSLESNNPIGQGSQSTNETNVTNDELETVVDTILTSSRQGRNLDGFDEVYSDPNVQEVLQKGDDRQARNVIKDKLCSLGLMDCEGEQIEGKRPFLPPGELIYSQPPPGYRKPNGPPNHYGPPRPMPPPNGNGNNFGPPRKVGYAYSPQQTFQTTQSFPGPVYHSKPPGPVYVDSKPPGPIYEGSLPPGPIYQGPKPPGPIFSGESGSPYKFENVVENFHSHGKYEVSGHEFQGPAKPTIVVNAQGGAATTGQTAASSVNIHHHYHHIDEGASKTPVVVNNPIPVPVPQLISGNAISSSSEFSSNSGGFSPLSSGYDYNKIKQGSSYSGAQFNGVNSGLGPVNGLSGSGVYGGGVKPVFEQTNSIGQSGYGSFDVGSSYTGNGQFGHTASGNYGGSNSQFGQSVSGVYNGNTESFHSSNPGYYKKALNTNGGTNSLSYSQSGYKQQFGQFGASGTGESYQGFDSNRQDNFDCVCVPYDQCPSVDIIGRKGDLILPLDPRNLKTDIEAVDEETVTITDGNGTMTVVRVPKDTVDNTNATNANSTNTTVAQDAPKKITKRDVSEKKADVQEKADGEARALIWQKKAISSQRERIYCNYTTTDATVDHKVHTTDTNDKTIEMVMKIDL
ncbi:hypothetical protein Bhyg_06851 [Pseudolycoriella hygida]|uniref:Uncharacterized protein n=1 Tax=Pseudolycoriella hygida TaxID=35572 RepID=A0A9Q0N2I8_9DIPT|nr:hypothetical protein Bhyg_06851 [Pseudolycoriella hygida]